MSSVVLVAEGVGKAFTSYNSNISRFANWFGASIPPSKEFWAVRGIEFELRAGEALALIGQNGAGKSTLLKLITGTLRATEGKISVHGRISAILELGIGFNPEFTGRQNIYQAGGLMGFSQQEITALMSGIEDFSELGSFLDEPLRVYSSGMHARLAFSLATAARPDILIVDEVLSVGDSYFQHKSFDRIRKFKEDGSAILFVSHSLGDVRTLCDRVLLLNKGKVLKDGPADEVADYYNAMIAEKESAKLSVEQKRASSGWLHTRSGTFDVIAETVELFDANSREPVAVAKVGQSLLLRLVARANTEIPKLVLGYMLKDRNGHVLWGTNTWHTKQVLTNVPPGQLIEFLVSFTCTLGPGSYSFSPALTSTDTHLIHNYEWQDNVIVFDVVNADKDFFIGSAWIDASFEVKRV